MSSTKQNCPRQPTRMKANQNAIPDELQHGPSKAVPTIVHQDGGIKYATDVSMSKICSKSLAGNLWTLLKFRYK